MDLNKMIGDLRAEKAVLDQAIATLQELQRSKRANSFVRERSPRGRKSMPPEERKEVALRMKRYWAARRKAQQR